VDKEIEKEYNEFFVSDTHMSILTYNEDTIIRTESISNKGKYLARYFPIKSYTISPYLM